MLKQMLSLSFLSLAMIPFAHASGVAPTPTPVGYLADFNYQVSSVSTFMDAGDLMDMEHTGLNSTSVCANRAEVWTYTMNHQKGLQMGKVFIHFTSAAQATEQTEWAYHVAPYVIVEGQEMVLDAGFLEFRQHPATMAEWQEHFGRTQHCVVLDPVHNPEHLKLEQNNLPDDDVTPLTFTGGNARQYPSKEGICYIRKVPMYYVYPFEVYGADLYHAGQPQFKGYEKTAFNLDQVYAACVQAEGSEKRCDKWFKNPIR